MFEPPRCPHPDCKAHEPGAFSDPRFYVRVGYYKPKCRSHRVPRFRCRFCRRGFSRQTFRPDYRDHKPHLNAPLRCLLENRVGLRECSRILDLSRRCTQLKARKHVRTTR